MYEIPKHFNQVDNIKRESYKKIKLEWKRHHVDLFINGRYFFTTAINNAL